MMKAYEFLNQIREHFLVVEKNLENFDMSPECRKNLVFGLTKLNVLAKVLEAGHCGGEDIDEILSKMDQ